MVQQRVAPASGAVVEVVTVGAVAMSLKRVVQVVAITDPEVRMRIGAAAEILVRELRVV